MIVLVVIVVVLGVVLAGVLISFESYNRRYLRRKKKEGIMSQYVPGPVSFVEEKDGVTYHLCDLSGHDHHIPAEFKTCYDPGSWTWESKYSWMAVYLMSSDLTFTDREIIPISSRAFGIVITEEEAIKYLKEGYTVKTVQYKADEPVQYWLKVLIGMYQEGDPVIDLAGAEMAGRADVVIFPYAWRIGRRSGTKAYAKSVTIKERGQSLCSCQPRK